jgi:hypothetical protein
MVTIVVIVLLVAILGVGIAAGFLVGAFSRIGSRFF